MESDSLEESYIFHNTRKRAGVDFWSTGSRVPLFMDFRLSGLFFNFKFLKDMTEARSSAATVSADPPSEF